jgi:membrane-bound metal-dependent hydrolase YbcI (DUF457 family)
MYRIAVRAAITLVIAETVTVETVTVETAIVVGVTVLHSEGTNVYINLYNYIHREFTFYLAICLFFFYVSLLLFWYRSETEGQKT